MNAYASVSVFTEAFIESLARDITYSDGGTDVLSEYNSLRFNNEEVNELMDITQCIIQSFLADCVVLCRSNLTCQTCLEQALAQDFCKNGDADGHVCQFECITEDIKVAGYEYECNSSKVCNTGSPGILP